MTTSENPVVILIADSQFLITESLKLILQNDGRFEANKIVTGKNEIIKALTNEKISLLIIDPSLTDLTGFSELKEIKISFPELKVVVLTNSLNKNELHELNTIGITNIILKTAEREEITEAINSALKGKKYYSNELMELLFDVGEKKNQGEDNGHITGLRIGNCSAYR